ncbi:hypothetical protein K438DRAFT_2030947, partial [Mycena galopus ATCC 62051]
MPLLCPRSSTSPPGLWPLMFACSCNTWGSTRCAPQCPRPSTRPRAATAPRRPSRYPARTASSGKIWQVPLQIGGGLTIAAF